MMTAPFVAGDQFFSADGVLLGSIALVVLDDQFYLLAEKCAPLLDLVGGGFLAPFNDVVPAEAANAPVSGSFDGRS